mgnify:CR=1 FL=1
MSRRRVVITGLGAVTPIGVGVDAFWNALLAGTNGIGPITRFDAADLPVRFAASVDWNPEERFRGPDFRKLDLMRAIRMYQHRQRRFGG